MSPDFAVAATPLALIADPHPDTRVAYAHALRSNGYDVRESTDGRDALVAALTWHPQLTIARVRLPVIDGCELSEILRRDSATKENAIILLADEPPELTRAQQVGANAVLITPCSVMALLRVAKLLSQRSRVPRDRASDSKALAAERMVRSEAALARSEQPWHPKNRRSSIQTTTPPAPPPLLICPNCDHVLKYHHSYLGGVNDNQLEQWDSFRCPSGCGEFQYRHRTRKMRRVS